MNIFEIVNPNEMNIGKLNSGHLCLELSSNLGWDQFPEFVDSLIHSFGGNIEKKTDAVDIRIWELKMSEENVRVVFEDFPLMVSLESDTEGGDILLKGIQRKLGSRQRE